MSGTHKYPTISLRISPRERQEIEAKIFASGMKKKDYFIRSCIYNRVCVVGKKETVYQIVEKLQDMEKHLTELAEDFTENKAEFTAQELEETKESYLDLIKAVLWMLDGAKYLWQAKKIPRRIRPEHFRDNKSRSLCTISRKYSVPKAPANFNENRTGRSRKWNSRRSSRK